MKKLIYLSILFIMNIYAVTTPSLCKPLTETVKLIKEISTILDLHEDVSDKIIDIEIQLNNAGCDKLQ